MKAGANNNKKIVTRLAVNSVKYNKLRNFFIIFTIALSVSLLTVMSLYTLGIEKSNERKVAKMQHVIYHGVTKEQTEKIADSDDVSLALLDKIGRGIEVDGKMIVPAYYEDEALKGNKSEIDTIAYKNGNAPKEYNEVGISEAYCKYAGVKAEIGTSVEVSFYDGSKEEFVISGILDIDKKSKQFPIILSKEYALNGPQLKNQTYDAIVRIQDAKFMSQDEFEDVARKIAADCEVEAKQVNVNNNFVDTLSGGDRQMQQILLIIVVGIGILFVSVLVIYSVFYLSVIGRIRQFGQLRTIGMTKKQIKKMITKEGLMLSAGGIPLGLLIGGIIGYFLQKDGWDWMNTLIVAGIVIVADIITVLLSIHKPAKIASTISPIEAAKYTGYDNDKGKKETKKLRRKINPFGLARMSATRNRKKTILTMISLGVGGVLFLLATTFIMSTSLEQYSRQSGFQYGEFTIDLSYNTAETSEHGIADLQVEKPFSDELRSRIESIDGVKNIRSFERAQIRWEAKGESSDDYIAGFERDEIPDNYIEEGSFDYNHMVENDGLLICGNDVVEEVFGWKFKVGDKVKIILYNGTKMVEKTYTVAGMVSNKYRIDNPASDWFLLPKDELTKVTNGMDLTAEWVISTEDGTRDKVEKSLDQIMSEHPSLTIDKLREREEQDKDSFTLLFSMILGLSIFIIVFSMINLVNTLITNVVTRKQEFAALESIGMTSRQVTQMIQWEGLLLAIGNVLITLCIGIPLCYAGVEVMKYFGAFYMTFQFPLLYFIGYIVVILVIPMLVSAFAIYSFKKQALVERLRQND